VEHEWDLPQVNLLQPTGTTKTDSAMCCDP